VANPAASVRRFPVVSVPRRLDPVDDWSARYRHPRTAFQANQGCRSAAVPPSDVRENDGRATATGRTFRARPEGQRYHPVGRIASRADGIGMMQSLGVHRVPHVWGMLGRRVGIRSKRLRSKREPLCEQTESADRRVAAASATGLDTDEKGSARRPEAGVPAAPDWDGWVFTPSAVVVRTRIARVKHYPRCALAAGLARPGQVLAVRTCP
jgi:hypothetical protein